MYLAVVLDDRGDHGHGIAPVHEAALGAREARLPAALRRHELGAAARALVEVGADDRGLVGITFDPNFAQNNYLYLYYTTTDGSGAYSFRDLQPGIYELKVALPADYPAALEMLRAMAPRTTQGFQARALAEYVARQGLDGLPDHLPNYEVAGASSRFPLAMISPPARNFLNSSFVNVRSLRDIEGEPLLEIHASDAAERGIVSGAVVRVFNDRGEYRCKAKISGRARAGVVHGLGIWWRKLGLDGTNVNELTSQKLTDMGRGPVFYDCLVEVRAV